MPAPTQYTPAQNSAPRAGGVTTPVVAPQPTPAAAQPALAVVAAPPRKLAAAQEPRRLPIDENIRPVQAAEEMPAPNLPELPATPAAPSPASPAASPASGIPSGAKSATRDPFDDKFPEVGPRSATPKTPIAPQLNPSVLRQPKPRTAMMSEPLPSPQQYSNAQAQPQQLMPHGAANPIHGEPEILEESVEMYANGPGGECGPGCDCDHGAYSHGVHHPALFGLRKFIRGTLLCVAGGCDPCDDGYFGCGPTKPCNLRWDRDLSIYAGAQGFRSPLDGNRSGNFGFFEGLNYGGAFWDAADIGYQIGGTAMQTTYDEGVLGGRDRQQYFVTGGFFHREMCGEGLQYGVVYDYMFDNTDESITLGQFRGELSYVSGGSELGFMCAKGTKEYDRTQRSFAGFTQYETVDQYALFYRIRTFGNGDARVWGGVDDNAQGLCGADFRAPINDALALTATFNYLSSDSPANADRNGEGWNFGIGLVYYPGSSSVSAGRSPYRPLFNVADNGTMMQRGAR